ncbi:MAG TPA: YkgJ family cysteine cluster protein [Vicinamibacteria bacterium]|nr:YkgJ family cysteine cluster protein [Vicinamibacteria bacterium]
MSRVPLPVIGLERPLVQCTECGRCCTYVGVGINPPTSARHATDVLWYLYHEGVYVYVDGEGEWSVHFAARCRHLGGDLRCGVYGERPHICRTFDNRTCEVNDPVHDSLTFREPAAFLEWLRASRPRIYARIEKGFVPRALRPGPVATPRTARAARRRAVARKARI